MLLRSCVLLAGLLIINPATAQTARQKMEAVPIGDVPAWFPPEDYPADAVRAGRSGRVVTMIGIDSTGQVLTCSIDVSSGTTSLDDKTCELVKARGRFNPATDTKGRPIASTRKFSVRWSVPAEVADNAIDLSRPRTTSVDVEWTIDPNGIVEACKSEGSAEVPDGCRKMPVGSQSGTRFVSDGAPVRAVVRERYTREMKIVALPQ